MPLSWKLKLVLKLNWTLNCVLPIQRKRLISIWLKKNHCQPRVIYRLEFNNISKLTLINNKRDERYLKGMNRVNPDELLLGSPWNYWLNKSITIIDYKKRTKWENPANWNLQNTDQEYEKRWHIGLDYYRSARIKA